MTTTATAAPAVLTERYRPRALDHVVGQGHAVFHLREWLKAPHPACFLFEGPTGTGKTSLAVALASELGCAVDEGEWGGFYRVPAGEQTADRVRELLQSTWTTPMGSADGWKVLVVEEADSLASNPTVEKLWLTGLEELAPRTVVIFTTNHAGKLADRVVDRFERFAFASDGAALGRDAQILINAIWLRETGTMDDAPKVETMLNVIDRDGNISFRRVVRNVETLLRHRRAAGVIPAVVPIAAAPPAAAVPNARALRAELRRLDRQFEALGEDYGAAEREVESIDRRIARARRSAAPVAELLAERGRAVARLDGIADDIAAVDSAMADARRRLESPASA